MNTTTVSEYDDNEIVNPSHNAHIGSMLAARLSRRSALKGWLADPPSSWRAGNWVGQGR